ncbi:MAG: helix-turn-helix transcriptional regulator, partial [Actinomycetota bacterium]|nr:helix-turn-helix transcriptional regulator [Actinomycetota bacterium]
GGIQLVLGDAGTGKSEMLRHLRASLRSRGMRVGAQPAPSQPADAPPPDVDVLVIDDLDQLTDERLAVVTEIASRATPPIVAASRPIHRRAALRVALTALTRESPPITLGGLTVDEIETVLAEVGGDHGKHAREVAAMTNGNRQLVAAARHAFAAGADMRGAAAAVAACIRDRLASLSDLEVEALGILSLRVEVGPTELAAALGIEPQHAADVIDSARCAGLCGDGPAFAADVRRQVLAAIGRTRMVEIEQQLTAALRPHGLVTDHLARQLSADGVVPSVQDRLDNACRLVTAGDAEAAGTVVDTLWHEVLPPPQRDRAVEIASTVATMTGQPHRAAKLYAWLDTTRTGDRSDEIVAAGGEPMRAIAEVAIGSPDRVLAFARGESEFDAPGLTTEVASMVATGLAQSLTEDSPAALHTLIRAAAAERSCGTGTLTAGRAVAVAALLAMHRGQLSRARAVLERSPAERLPPMHRPRHRVLMAWVHLLEGDVEGTAAHISHLTDQVRCVRDELAIAALRVAVARRRGDPAQLRAAWDAAANALGECEIDLFGLLFVGELWVAAAALGETEEIAPLLAQLRSILHGIGDAPQWSVATHWYGVHAAIAAESPSELIPHAQALAAAGRANRQAATLARAGRVWVHVLGGKVTPEDVEMAARGLDRYGYAWDGARLAGHAALQATDARVSAAMLQLARSLRTYRHGVAPGGDPTPDAVPASSAPGERATPGPAVTALSEREREVAVLLLSGITYRGIGEQLFISAKTVEHHVARIRRRIGAETRSEMLSMLRAMQLGRELTA